MVLKLVLLPIHSFWRRKSYMVLKPDFFDVPMNFQLGRVIAGFSNKHCVAALALWLGGE